MRGGSKPKEIKNACSILQEKKGWNKYLVRASKKWSTTPETIMAIIYQESSFNSRAKPKPLPGHYKPASSAYGYAQALDGTWDLYKKNNNVPYAHRDNFADAVEFVGWYIYITKQKNNIKKGRADNIYLSYHEGWGGYKRKTYLKKPWLIKVAKKVQARQNKYRKQIKSCNLSKVYIPRNLKQIHKNVFKGARQNLKWF
jgi:hypothetical protein